MLALVPRDVWLAVALAFMDAISPIFGFAHAMFITIYVAMCLDVLLAAFGGETSASP